MSASELALLEPLPGTSFELIAPLAKKFLKHRFCKSVPSIKPVIDKLNEYVTVHANPLNEFVSREKYLEQKYLEHMKYLTSKDTMVAINNVLVKFYRWYKHDPKISVKKITPRTFMIAWTIVSFPNEVVEMSRDDVIKDTTYVGDVFVHSFALINATKELLKSQSNENIRKFVKNVNKFCNCFHYFLELDRNKKISQLANQWYGMQKNIDMITESTKYPSEEKKEECIDVIRNSMKKHEKHILELSPTFKVAQLPQLAKVADAIDGGMIKAYKNKLEQTLNDGKYELVKKVLTEIKKAVLVFNSKIEKELNEIINIDFLVEQHAKGHIVLVDMISIGNYLAGVLFPLSSKEGERIMDEKWKELSTELESYESMNKVLAEVLIFMMDQIEDIKENIMNIQLAAALGVNIFLHEKSPMITYGCGYPSK